MDLGWLGIVAAGVTATAALLSSMSVVIRERGALRRIERMTDLLVKMGDLKNSALQYLYVLGGLAVVAGILMGTIAAFNVVTSNPYSGGVEVSSVAAAFQTLGFGLASTGLLAIVGGGVAQAINWQLINPRDDSQGKTYREYKAEHE